MIVNEISKVVLLNMLLKLFTKTILGFLFRLCHEIEN